ncbi:hypothetical protein H9L39_00482 [Fusarium oxysporum f. sp. albedinis]|nr:hypothetical protein H9L39_00482 [Fusarium oxysporum f. sp. albedinis]
MCRATDDESRLKIAIVVKVTHATRSKTPESPIRGLAAGSLQEYPGGSFHDAARRESCMSSDTDPHWWQPMTSALYLVVRAIDV